MPTDVLAATLVAPFDLRMERYPYPQELDPVPVLLRMLASEPQDHRGRRRGCAGV